MRTQLGRIVKLVDNHLVTFAEAARRCNLSERTVRRWAGEGLIDRYWWDDRRQKGPRVSLEQVQSIRATPIESHDGRRTFSINNPRRGYVTVLEAASGETCAAVALWDAVIDRACVHPEGLLLLTAGVIGKITKNSKGAWTYGPCSRSDLEVCGVAGVKEWEEAANSLRAHILPLHSRTHGSLLGTR